MCVMIVGPHSSMDRNIPLYFQTLTHMFSNVLCQTFFPNCVVTTIFSSRDYHMTGYCNQTTLVLPNVGRLR